MTQTNPEQWALDLLADIIDIGGLGGPCSEADCVECGKVALKIQAAFAERESRLVGGEREAIINWLRGGAGTDTTTLAKPMRILFLRGLHSYADAIERGDHLAALKDRTQ